MKKAISYFIALVMLFTVFPINAFATDSQPNEREELINSACDAFPEYKEYILGNISTYSDPSKTPEIIFCETRQISETEEITYAQYSNGRAIIVGSEYEAFGVSHYDPSQSNFAGGYDYNFSVKVVTTYDEYPGIFYVTNCKCRIMSEAYDSLLSIGTHSVNDTNLCKPKLGSINYTETSNQYAKVDYDLTFLPENSRGTTSSDDMYATLTIAIGNNDVSATVR